MQKDTMIADITKKEVHNNLSGFDDASSKLVQPNAGIYKRLESARKKSIMNRADSTLLENISMFSFRDTENKAA